MISFYKNMYVFLWFQQKTKTGNVSERLTMKFPILLILLGAAGIAKGLSLDSKLELQELLDTLEHDLNAREERRLDLQDAESEERGLDALEVREESEEQQGNPEERILLKKGMCWYVRYKNKAK